MRLFCIIVVLFYPKVALCVVHEPKWSLTLASTGAVLGFIARLFGTKFMMDDRDYRLEFINKTLDMKKIAHLDPLKARADTGV